MPEAATVWKVRIAFAGLIVWSAAMLYLVASSANPPIVSRPQVLSADAVVEGVLEVGKETRLKPDRVRWSRRPLQLEDFPADGILVVDQKASWMTTGDRAVAPLDEVEPGRFRVQPMEFESPFPKLDPEYGPAPIYPATNVVLKQFDQLAPKREVP